MTEPEDIIARMDACADFLKFCDNTDENYGLTVECLCWAMDYYRDNPEITMAAAFAHGIGEWVK